MSVGMAPDPSGAVNVGACGGSCDNHYFDNYGHPGKSSLTPRAGGSRICFDLCQVARYPGPPSGGCPQIICIDAPSPPDPLPPMPSPEPRTPTPNPPIPVPPTPGPEPPVGCIPWRPGCPWEPPGEPTPIQVCEYECGIPPEDPCQGAVTCGIVCHTELMPTFGAPLFGRAAEAVPGPSAAHSQLVVVKSGASPFEPDIFRLWVNCTETGVTLSAACGGVTFYHNSSGTKNYTSQAGSGMLCVSNPDPINYNSATGSGSVPNTVTIVPTTA